VIIERVSYRFFSFLAASDQKDLATSPFAGVQVGQPGQPQDFNKLFSAESENLQLAQGVYQWVGDGIDERILRKYGKLPAGSH
jgi:ER membrane protein complex subunit 3